VADLHPEFGVDNMPRRNESGTVRIYMNKIMLLSALAITEQNVYIKRHAAEFRPSLMSKG
jgi:hypothetical protein